MAFVMMKYFLFDFNSLDLCFDNTIKIYHNLNAKIPDNIERILNWIPEIFFTDDPNIVCKGCLKPNKLNKATKPLTSSFYGFFPKLVLKQPLVRFTFSFIHYKQYFQIKTRTLI